MKAVSKVLIILKNKYLIATAAFLFILLSFDHNNLFEQAGRKQQLNELQQNKAFYENEIAKTKQQLADLQSNASALEKYAREKFFMKKDNEDLFLTDTVSTPEKNKK